MRHTNLKCACYAKQKINLACPKNNVWLKLWVKCFWLLEIQFSPTINNQTLTHKYDTLQRYYIIMHFSTIRSIWSLIAKENKIREHRQKTFTMLSRFWLLRGRVVWVNPSKKQNLWRESFFQIMLNKVLKIWGKWHPLM